MNHKKHRMNHKTSYCDGVKETILHEDYEYRFLITTHEGSTEGKHVFFQKVLANPIASGWKYFQTEKEAFQFGNDFVNQYLNQED